MSTTPSPAPLTLDLCRQHAPVALPPIHLPRWLVNEALLWTSVDDPQRVEKINALVFYFLALGVAAHKQVTAAETPAPVAIAV